MPSRAHSAFVTWLGGGGRLISVSCIYIYIYILLDMYDWYVGWNIDWF